MQIHFTGAFIKLLAYNISYAHYDSVICLFLRKWSSELIHLPGLFAEIEKNAAKGLVNWQ